MILTEVPWVKNGPDNYEYKHEQYTFKKKGKPGSYRYQVWEKGEMIDNSLPDEFAVLRYIRDGNRKQKLKSFDK